MRGNSRVVMSLAASAILLTAARGAASSLSDRQVLAVFRATTVNMPDSVVVAETAEVISIESGISGILSSFGINEIARAFPDFDRADTVGVAFGGETVRLTDWSKVWLLTLPEGQEQGDLIASLMANPAAVLAEPNGTGLLFSSPRYPNDDLFKNGSQWGLWAGTGGGNVDVNAPWAWGDTTGSSSVRVAIIDEGFTGSVSDLAGRVISTDGTGPRSNHAYRVAGVLGANTDNSLGISGVDWNARLISRKGGGNFPDVTTIQAIYNVSDLGTFGARVLNASWGLIDKNGAPRYSHLVEAAFKDRHTLNEVSVAAIGNSGTSGLDFVPASFQHGVISVGAVNRFGGRWSSSSTSPQLDLKIVGDERTVGA